jgi:intein-encoded DNA endonuclease-like protein
VENWSLTLREKNWLRVFENRVLERELGLRGTRWQVSGERYVYNEELYDLFSSPNIIQVIKSR